MSLGRGSLGKQKQGIGQVKHRVILPSQGAGVRPWLQTILRAMFGTEETKTKQSQS